MLSVAVGTSEATYAHNGRSGDIDLMPWPVNFSLAYAGYTVPRPFVAYGVEAGLRYSGRAEIEARLRHIEAGLAACMGGLDALPTIPFNRMATWGNDGRIKPDAPVRSPFIRHVRDLPLKQEAWP